MSLYALTLAYCAAINAAVPPTAGVPGGGGIHVEIPPDWRGRIAAGEHVAGCSYVLPDAAGNVEVADELLVKLNASGKPQAIAVASKLALAEPVVIADVLIAEEVVK